MNANPENFDALRKLLVLKRHELPPPGYFDRLPGLIMARLERGEEKPTFWSRFLAGFILRPAFAYTLGLVFCGALATGVSYALRLQPTQAAAHPLEPTDWGVASLTPESSADYTPSAPRLHVAGFTGFDTNDTSQPQTSLFNYDVRTSPVNFEMPAQ